MIWGVFFGNKFARVVPGGWRGDGLAGVGWACGEKVGVGVRVFAHAKRSQLRDGLRPLGDSGQSVTTFDTE